MCILYFIVLFVVSERKVNSDFVQSQILEARQLFPYRSYKDVQMFHYNLPQQVTYASFQYKANGSFHCPAKAIAVYLQFGSYPVMTLQNSTFPESFVIDRLFINDVILYSNSVPVTMNITNPLPGDWFAAAFLMENTDRIAQKGLFTPCLSWLSSSLKFTTTSDIIDVLPNFKENYELSFTKLYRFYARKSSWNSIIKLVNCYPDVHCNVIIRARQIGLPSNSDNESIITNCNEYNQCILKMIPAQNNWNYISIENLSPVINFTMIIRTEDCKNSFIESSITEEATKASGDVNLKSIQFEKESEQFSNSNDSSCWFNIPLIRISLPINLAFEYNLPPEDEDTYPFILNISSMKYTFTSFDVFPTVDIGGTMIIELGISPFINISLSNVGVSGCLSYGIRSDSDDFKCMKGNFLVANTTSWENRFRSIFIPYPEAGTWFLRINTFCYTSNSTNESVEIISCDSPITPVFLRIRSTPCVKGNCGKYGNCYQYVSGALIFSTCNCIAGWKGWGCTDNSTALSDGELMLDVLLLTLSNLLFIPLVILSIYRKYYTEAFVYFATMMSSAFYHACDAEVYSYCMIRLSVLQFCDFYSAILSIWVTLIAMAKLPLSAQSFAHMTGAVGVALGVEYDRTGLWVFVIPTGIGLLILLLSWVNQCHKKQACYPAKKVWLLGLLPGSILALSGLIIYAFYETKDNYPFVHSAWHITIALSVLFLLPMKVDSKIPPQPASSCSYIRVGDNGNHDTSQLPVAPYVHLLTPTP